MIEKLNKMLLSIIDNGEGTMVEFKEAKEKLPNNLFETVCSMLNRNGGHIFLGVKDNGKIIGIDKNYIKNIKKDFSNLCNNPQKLFPTTRLDIKEFTYNDEHILYINVHESSDVHKTNNKIYDRNEDGDFEITNNTSLISEMYIRKRNTYIENKIYPYATMEDLRIDLIEKVRKMAVIKNNDHPWKDMTNEELLKSASLYDRSLETGKEGFNLACILLFGKDETIKSALSYYKTDAILRIEDVERYDDREDIRTNLIESYEKLMNFISKHLNDSYYLEKNIRISPRDIIAREVIVNLLIHREFSNPYPARLIITKNSLLTENANKPRTIGYIDINNYIPYTKNPKIASVFKEIGLADELGSGIKKIVKYTKIYSRKEPIFKDGDVFTVTIPLNTLKETKELNNLDLKKEIFDFISNSNGKTRTEINEFIHLLLNQYSNDIDNKIRTILTSLRKENLIKNFGSDTKPLWKKYNIRERE